MTTAPSNAPISRMFLAFVQSEQAAGLLLAACTIASVALANSAVGAPYVAIWQRPVVGVPLAHWINDALMALFFLLIGLELERELYDGELRSPRQAILPIAAALGGMLLPAALHYSVNAGTISQAGIGIPMATDVAFALAAMSALGARIPSALKVFLVALAVIDDLGAIILIAAVYTPSVNIAYLAAALLTWAALLVLNLRFNVQRLWVYLIGGALMWMAMHKSGVHATLAGVLLAFAIPFRKPEQSRSSLSARTQAALHLPVALLVLPLFALCNTAVRIEVSAFDADAWRNGIGIALGLLVGKPLGIVLGCVLTISTGLATRPAGFTWGRVAGVGMLGGIGFTMSIFVANLAFGPVGALSSASKLAIMASSGSAALLGVLILWAATRRPIDSRPTQPNS